MSCGSVNCEIKLDQCNLYADYEFVNLKFKYCHKNLNQRFHMCEERSKSNRAIPPYMEVSRRSNKMSTVGDPFRKITNFKCRVIQHARSKL